jgi:hypothetical protein
VSVNQVLRFKEEHIKGHQLLSVKIETVLAKRQPGQPKGEKKSSETLGYRVMAMLGRKAVPNNKTTGGPQPPILEASDSLYPPGLGAGGPPVISFMGIA